MYLLERGIPLMTLWASTALLGPSWAAPTEPSAGVQTPYVEAAVDPAPAPTAPYSCKAWRWTLDDSADWSWKVSWSFYFRRWIWSYCSGVGADTYGWSCCYFNSPPDIPDSPHMNEVVSLSAPAPTGDPPPCPPPGAPSGPAPLGAPTTPPIIVP